MVAVIRLSRECSSRWFSRARATVSEVPAQAGIHVGGDWFSAVGEYLDRREVSGSVEPPEWPAGVVPILTWGCAMYAGVDCLSAEGRVLLFEPNPYSGGSWAECWFLDSAGLAVWLETWLAGTGWFEEDACDRDDVVEPRPWDEAVSRLSSGA